MFTRFLTSTALVLAMAGPAFAQTTTPAPSGQTPPAAGAPAEEKPAAVPPPAEKVITEQEESQVRSEKVVGMDVVNPQDETVGRIADLIFDEEGRIIGAVVSVGGFLGIGAKNVALSWNEFQIRPEEEVAVIQLTREQLEAAPSFKSLEEKKAEEDAARQQQSAPGGGMGGAPGGGTTR